MAVGSEHGRPYWRAMHARHAMGVGIVAVLEGGHDSPPQAAVIQRSPSKTLSSVPLATLSYGATVFGERAALSNHSRHNWQMCR